MSDNDDRADATPASPAPRSLLMSEWPRLSPAGLGRGVPAGPAATERWCRKSLRRGQSR